MTYGVEMESTVALKQTHRPDLKHIDIANL